MRKNTWIVCRRELKDTLRDRRTLFVMIVLPILLYPLLLLGISRLVIYQSMQIKGKPARVVLTGVPDDLAPFLNENARGQTFTPVQIESPEEKLTQGAIDAWLHWGSDQTGPPQLTVHYNGANERSRLAQTELISLVKKYRRHRVLETLRQRGEEGENILRPFQIVRRNAASSERQGGYVFGKILALILVLMCVSFPFYPAIDTAAGEKERGTLETLLVSPATRGEIVAGKYLSVLTISLVGSLLNLASMGITFTHFTHLVNLVQNEKQAEAILQTPSAPNTREPSGTRDEVIEKRVDLQLSINPRLLAGILLILVPLSGFLAAVSLAISTFARSYKEGQYYLTPLIIVVLPLAMVSLLPNAWLNLPYCFIPITGPVLLFKSMFLGQVNPLHFVAVLGSTCLYALFALRCTWRLFENEEVLFREATFWQWRFWRLSPDRGHSPTIRQATLLFFLAILSLWFVGQPLQIRDLATGLALTQILLILGLTLGICWLYRFPVRSTLGLQAARPTALLAGILLGLGGFLIGRQIVHEQFRLFPNFRETLGDYDGGFGRFLEQNPPLLILAVICILPAICEEVMFRGFILRSLLKEGRPVRAVLLSALAFALMHLSIERLPFTFVLGVLLGFGVLYSSSLLVGIVAHFTSNLMALGALRIPIEGFADVSQSLPGWLILGGFASVLVAILLLRRDRSAGRAPRPDASP